MVPSKASFVCVCSWMSFIEVTAVMSNVYAPRQAGGSPFCYRNRTALLKLKNLEAKCDGCSIANVRDRNVRYKLSV